MKNAEIKEKFLIAFIDLIKGTSVLKWFNFFRNTVSWDYDKINQYRIEQVRKLLWHAKNTVPYYQRILKDFTPFDIRSLDNLRHLPILERDDLQKNNLELISELYLEKKLFKGSSSGTTGIPIKYFIDNNGLSAGIAAGYTLMSLSGWHLGQRNVHIWGNQITIKQWKKISSRLKNFLIQQKNIPSTLLDDPNEIPKIVSKIQKFRPESIDGYASAIFTLASYYHQNNIIIDTVRQVFTTAENLTNDQKELIEKVFGPTSDLYGCGEVLGVAVRTIHDNKYFILDPHVIVETLESEIPGFYHILLTDLDNYAMPMIRYKVGDLIDEIHYPDDYQQLPYHWFSKLHGRASDIITLPNGMRFHPVNIFGGTLFRKFPEITRHKVIWNGKKLKFIFESRTFRKNDDLKNALDKLLEKYQVDFEIEYTDRIYPSANGKYKYVEVIDQKE